MIALRRRQAQTRLSLMFALLVAVVMTLSGCEQAGSPPQTISTPRPTQVRLPDPECTKNPLYPFYPYGYKIDTSTNIPGEEPYLREFVVCSETLSGGATIITNNSDLVWNFVGAGRPVLLGGANSAMFREAVKVGNLYPSPYIAPGDTMTLPSGDQWNVQPALTADWLAQDEYKSLLTKYSTSAATSIFAQGSKSKAALIGCAIGFGQVASGKVTGSSTEDTVIKIFADVKVASTCNDKLKAASPEIKPGKMDALLKDAGSVAENGEKVHSLWNLVTKFCAVTHKCV